MARVHGVCLFFGVCALYKFILNKYIAVGFSLHAIFCLGSLSSNLVTLGSPLAIVTCAGFRNHELHFLLNQWLHTVLFYGSFISLMVSK